jgi:hypothetical protein
MDLIVLMIPSRGGVYKEGQTTKEKGVNGDAIRARQQSLSNIPRQIWDNGWFEVCEVINNMVAINRAWCSIRWHAIVTRTICKSHGLFPARKFLYLYRHRVNGAGSRAPVDDLTESRNCTLMLFSRAEFIFRPVICHILSCSFHLWSFQVLPMPQCIVSALQ